MTQVSRAVWTNSLTTLINTNTEGEISAEDVRAILGDLEDSVSWYDESAPNVADGTYGDIVVASGSWSLGNDAIDSTDMISPTIMSTGAKLARYDTDPVSQTMLMQNTSGKLVPITNSVMRQTIDSALSATLTGVTGSGSDIVTGTAGSDGDFATWDNAGNIIGGQNPTNFGSLPNKASIVTTDALVGYDTEASNIFSRFSLGNVAALFASLTETLTNKTLTDPKVSFNSYNAGTQSSGTFTPTYTNGNTQTATNGGAHTFAPQSGNGSIVVHYTNNSSAGSIATSGFTIVTGDSLTTTDSDEFLFYSVVIGSVSHLNIVALQ